METDRKRTDKLTEKSELSFVEGEISEIPGGENSQIEEETFIPGKSRSSRAERRITVQAPEAQRFTVETTPVKQLPQTVNQKNYLLLPVIFLTVTLLGGLRLSAAGNEFLFIKPALVCLIFALVLLVLFFRASLIELGGWFAEDFSGTKNAANAAILLTLFAASAQVFNALLPERGLPFWIVAFCFFWTLWNNLFAEFDTAKLLKSLGALFGLAFVVKYLLLASLIAPPSENWWQGILQNPAQESLTYLLDLPRFAAGTGYVQFFTLIFYLLGLFLLPNSTVKSQTQI